MLTRRRRRAGGATRRRRRGTPRGRGSPSTRCARSPTASSASAQVTRFASSARVEVLGTPRATRLGRRRARARTPCSEPCRAHDAGAPWSSRAAGSGARRRPSRPAPASTARPRRRDLGGDRDPAGRAEQRAHRAGRRRPALRPASSASVTRAAKTMPSSSEFDASRFAPCTPVQATSPTAKSPGSAVAPSRSVRIPPARWWAAGAIGSQSTVGSRPAAAGSSDSVGNLDSNSSSPVASSHRLRDVVACHLGGHRAAHDVARRELVDEPLARGVAQQRPVAPERLGEQRPRHRGVVQGGRVELHELDVGTPPRPRAARSRARRRSPRAGSSSPRTAGPRRRSRERPRRPRARGGRSRHAPRRRGTRRPRRAGRTATACSRIARDGALGRRRRARARPPRRSPRRRRAGCAPCEWPPSRARWTSPVASRSKTAPSAISSSTRAGPSSTSTRTASTSHSPAPARSVSARCRSVESSSSWNTAATPPCAQRVVVSDERRLGHDADLHAGVGEADRDREPGDAAADDERVEAHRRAHDGADVVDAAAPTSTMPAIEQPHLGARRERRRRARSVAGSTIAA